MYLKLKGTPPLNLITTVLTSIDDNRCTVSKLLTNQLIVPAEAVTATATDKL